MAHKIKVAALQKRMGGNVPLVEFESLRDKGVDIACLPEYYFVTEGIRNQVETATRMMAILQRIKLYSEKLVGVVVGGTLVEEDNGKYYNTCVVFDCGKYIGSYRKMFPTPKERESGISPGDESVVLEVRGIRLGLLICADVLYQASFKKLGDLKPDIIAVPTTSPFQPGEPVAEKQKRDNDIFVHGARLSGAYILKACGVGVFMREKLQGRSLIAAPWGLITGVSPRSEMLETTLIADLEIATR